MKDTSITDKPPPASANLKTAITLDPPAPPPLVGTEFGSQMPPPMRTATAAHPLWQALSVVASLRLTVVLFFLAFLLVYWGTWAQVDKGIWTVVEEYFRNEAFVMIPVKVLSSGIIDSDFALPFPGGWLLGGLLLINLLAAHIVRFKFAWRRSGILILHSGIILMMLGELITGLYQVEGFMTIPEGQKSNYIEHEREPELAIVDASHAKMDDVVVIGRPSLRRRGPVQDPTGQLPFQAEVMRFYRNSGVLDREPQGKDRIATKGAAANLTLVERPEVSGVGEQKIDYPAVFVKLTKDGEDLGVYGFSYHLNSQTIKVDGKDYDVTLRPRRSYRHFTIHLIKFNHDKFQGVNIPKNFASEIRLVDSRTNDERHVVISMNDPLRYGGETFYQASFLPGDAGTVLQVVRNPGWLMPYFACAIVCLGMLIHFGIILNGFLQKRLAS